MKNKTIKKHILFNPTEKELKKLIKWAENEITEYSEFLFECHEKMKELTNQNK
jgi:hypothetical protein